MSTEIATIQNVLPQPVSQQQSEAWLGMAKAKNELTANLATYELQAQSILLPVKNSEDYVAIDDALAVYRKHHTTIVETRKAFTNSIDTGIVQPLMAYEKRVDPKVNEEYLALTNKSLTLRKTEADKAALQNAKNAEVASFKAHIHNEFARVVFEYKNHIRREIYAYYQSCLKIKDKGDIEQIKVFLSEIKPPAVAKFKSKYLSNEELSNIYIEAHKPDYVAILNELVGEFDNVFANFESDVSNADAAIAHQQQQQQLAAIEDEKKLQEDTAINTLIANSEAVVMDTPKIKTTLQIAVIESEAWAKAVMAAFIINLPQLAKYIRVKSWSKLSIGQMAEYLSKLATDEGVKFSNLQLIEMCK